MRHAYKNWAFVYTALALLLFLSTPLAVYAATVIDSDTVISADTVWTAEAGPYVIVGGLQIAPGAKLSIAAGTKVQFEYGAFMVVYGAIEALGTAEQPITFTSLYEGETCFDTDEGPQCEPTAFAGDWDGIYIVE